ncbi:hypothetical protein GCM10009557_59480 [Virgisporangium ochraceum]
MAVTQTVGYGVLYYSFAVLMRPIAVTLQVSTATVTGAMTCSILAGAVMAVPVGRWLDRRGGRALMTTGSLAATGLLVAWSQVQQAWQLYAVLIGIGVTGAMVLYEPAFAVVVSWFDSVRRPKALLGVTLVAGFASAIFLPLAGSLVDRYGWRTALLVLAVVHGAVTVPLHALVVRKAPHLEPDGPRPAATDRTAGDRAAVVRAALRDARFWAMAVAFVAHGAAMTAMTFHLVGLLTDAGHPATFAATVAGLLGVLSVTGRIVLTGAQRRIRMTTVVAAIFAVQAVAALSLLVVGRGRGVRARVRCRESRRTGPAGRPVRHRRLRHDRRQSLRAHHPGPGGCAARRCGPADRRWLPAGRRRNQRSVSRRRSRHPRARGKSFAAPVAG